MEKEVLPYAKDFVPALESYCAQIREAIANNQHHDQRRHLFVNFLHKGFGIEAEEIELEHKIKANQVRGRIDAFFRHLIIEFKSDLDRERAAAQAELKKYFEAQAHPLDYVALVTEGLQFEVYLYAAGDVKQISAFELEAVAPLLAFRHLDQILFTGKLLVPSSGDIVIRFGQSSAVFNASLRLLGELFDSVQGESLVKTKLREWNSLLAKVYGSALGDKTLFLKHTYLTIVSRAIVTAALFPTSKQTLKQYRGIVDGDFFKNQSLKNLAEPDFFSWALDTPVEKDFLGFVQDLFTRLGVYNFAKLDEDILKELYQELVDPESRRELGEYYTPDWLAELTLENIDYKKGKLLDPACGSGSFLFAAVQRLRANGLSGTALVSYTLDKIIGIDVHPVAVLMAKANLLLSLRNEIKTFSSDITLRVYMADSLLTEYDSKKNTLNVPVTSKEVFHIPLETVEKRKLDDLIDKLSSLATRGAKSAEAEKQATDSAKKQFADLSEMEKFYWMPNFRLMLKLEKEHRNSIWPYILKNAYRPVFLREEKVDYLVGNPPWLSYRYIKDESYKRRVKDLTFHYGLLGKKEVKLFTQMDASTLFFVHCRQEFLKKDGTLAFVLPKSVIVPSKQHARFQRLGFSQVHDFTDVEPLFKVRTCLLVCGKTFWHDSIPLQTWSGNLERRNASLAEAKKVLKSSKGKFDFVIVGEAISPYYKHFLQGATLMPRCLCFVEPPIGVALNAESPFLRTSEDAWNESKPEWRLKVEGRVEKQYLFGTVLAKDLIPFVVRKLSLVALPVKENSHRDLQMINALDALGEGFEHAHDWFQETERIWNKKRKDKKRSFQAWLNYNNKLTEQTLRTPSIVLYNKSGKNISAAYLTTKECKRIGQLSLQGFIADCVCYRYYAQSEDEAAYLVGILNSSVVNDAIKPYQSQGLLGERDIHRRPFEVCPIPLFDTTKPLHLKIAELARQCREELLPIVPKMQTPVATARADARHLVEGKLHKLDDLVRKLLGNPTPKTTYPSPGSEPLKLMELF